MPRRRDEGSERRCIVSRRTGSPDEMIRFVAGPDGAVVPDIRRKLPGRGVWVTASRAAVDEAVRRKAFGRGLKAAVTVSPTLAAEVEELLRRDAVQALALANKAGAVVTGFGKVEDAVASGAAVALVHAREAAEDGRRKLAQAVRRRGRAGGDQPSAELPVVGDFAEADLDLALGRAHVIHAALVAGPGSEGFLTRWRRLARYGADGPSGTGVSGGASRSSEEAPSGDLGTDTGEPAGFERNE
ncbi:RNA-binding protein [Chelatococcus sp. SYSU_G07232]|uniref:RNA-binding protein n=1 Tax=Chelatococcus albus TaxID=3047466 RepID=A0ABT7AHA5_9HYPH|nr:RNA-binding protein [Chelatococcus sp. SYSU_G07232]MDJ1158760.1 RNA-binding protein [Chelatococcus sp. SYSU_G07232]